MAKTMITSPMTEEQIGRAAGILTEQLRKHAAKLPRNAVQVVFGQKDLGHALLGVFRTRVEARIRFIEPHILKRKPFDPVQFIGKGWGIDESAYWRIGKRTGDTLDAGKIITKDFCRKGDDLLDHNEHFERIFKRIKAEPADVHLDANDFLALWSEKGHKTLDWLRETRGITKLAFWGTTLTVNGFHLVFYLVYYRSWSWGHHWIDRGMQDDPGSLPAILVGK